MSLFVELRILRKESLSSELHGLSNRAGISLKPSSKGWRPWISEKPGAKLSAGFMELRRIQQPTISSGFYQQHLQLNRQSTLADAEALDVGKSMCSAKGILQAFGRALFILGVGLSLSLPASARTVAAPVSEVSAAGKFQKNGIQRSEAAKERKGDVDANASHECNVATQHSISSETDTSRTTADKLHLSDAFWRGIPTSEGSLMHSLKVQLNENPSDVKALEALLQVVLEQRDMLRALTVVETLLEVQPNNVEWKFLKARTHEFLGELFMAEQEYEELLSLYPLSARFLQGLVKLLNGVGEQTQALQRINNALNQAISEGKNMEARNLGVLLSQFYIQLGNFEDALNRLSSMIEEDPDDFRPYLCQGLAYALMKEMDKARQSFKKYMQLCPPDAFDQNYLDSLLWRAQTNKRVDALKNKVMKGTSKNRKKAKPMKQPSIFGNPNLHREEYAG